MKDETHFRLRPSLPVSYALGSNLVAYTQKVQLHAKDPGWKDAESVHELLDALLHFSYQAVNAVQTLEGDIGELRHQLEQLRPTE